MFLLQKILSAASWVEVVLAQFALRSLEVQDRHENCLVLAHGIVIDYRALGSGSQASKHVKDLICSLLESVLRPWRNLNPPMHCLERSIIKPVDLAQSRYVNRHNLKAGPPLRLF